MHCCRLTGVVSHGSRHRYHSDGLGGSAAEGTPRETQSPEQAIDVRMADVQSDQQPQIERVWCLTPTQPCRIRSTGLRRASRQGNAESLHPAAVVTWTGERLLKLATSLPAMRTLRHQPRSLRQRTCTILKKLLQHHTHCHHQSVKRRDSESLQAELAAAWWAWLGPTLPVRACVGVEHAVNDGLTPGAAPKGRLRESREARCIGRDGRVDRTLAFVCP